LRLTLLVAGFFFAIHSSAQYCVLPTSLTSGTLSYIRLPDGDASNFRFFYKVIVECGGSSSFGFDGLHVIDPMSASTTGKIVPWQIDSINKITGVLDPCVTLNTPPCFTVYYYHADVQSPISNKSFLVSTTYCCRPYDAVNIRYSPSLIGYSNPEPNLGCPNAVPGPIGNAMSSLFKMPSLNDPFNSSPQFSNQDTILTICKDRPLTYQIRAADPDGDSIAYHFSTPRTYSISLDNKGNQSINYRKFPQLHFQQGYSEQEPAGPQLRLDPVTGILEGTVADAGTYDITISVLEYRGGILLDSVTEDLFIKAYDCGVMAKPVASIPDSINSCTDFTIHFPNFSQPIYQSVNWNNSTFRWDFGDGDSSSDVYPVHLYSDTGTYRARLIIFPGLYCADTSYSEVVVYPFVHADFTYSDSCNARNIQFMNTSTSSSGTINSSEWMVIEKNDTLFKSDQYNTSYNFSDAPQTYRINLTVGNDKGCRASDSIYLNIYQSPYPLASHDTILSRGANMQMSVNDGNQNFSGQYQWLPAEGLSDPNIAEPLLVSTTDTTYRVRIQNYFGCILEDSIRVKYYSGPEIYVPNAFSPNGDGKNDIFKPIEVGISMLNYFRVFNRYGQNVFFTRTPHQGWDGYTGGMRAQEGAYIWEVSGVDLNGRTIFKKGTVILVR